MAALEPLLGHISNIVDDGTSTALANKRYHIVGMCNVHRLSLINEPLVMVLAHVLVTIHGSDMLVALAMHNGNEA